MLDIFSCYEARLCTLPDAPTLRQANEKQLREHRGRLEILNADKIVPRFGTDPTDEDNFFASAANEMLLREDLWRQCGLTWAWIDERPVWVSPVDWCPAILPDGPILRDPETATDRRFRFTMLGGGQITATERFRFSTLLACAEPILRREQYELNATTDGGDGIRRFRGVIQGVRREMHAEAALFTPGTPQGVADRVAATFRLLTAAEQVGTSVRCLDANNLLALLDRGKHCCICRRPLRDRVSTLLGIGPDCAKRMGLPHGLEVADKILKRRRELLGA
jgi:hypothetical protein